MTVAPEIRSLLEAMAAEAGEAGSMDEIRSSFEATCAGWATPSPALAAVADRTAPGPAGPIPLRVYTPQGDGPFPVVVFLHGGGFFVGSLDSHDPVCRELAARAGAVVVSVDYRLAPEHLWPAAPDDCWAALRWVADHAAELGGDPDRLAVAGDSAGGDLAAVTAVRARDEGGPELRLQVLLYPVTDSGCDRPSMSENAEGYFLTRDAMVMTWSLYAPGDAATEPSAAPLRTPDLAGVAPAVVVTAGFDPLRDEGVAYVERLREAGVEVDHHHHDDMIHGFVQMLAVTPRAAEEIEAVAEALRRSFAA